MAIKRYLENPNAITNLDFTTDEASGVEQDATMKVIREADKATEYARYTTIDDLVTTNTEKPLSANQGKILKDAQDIIKGTGWTNETIKDNADAIATKESIANVDTLKGTGWVNETVKGNADNIDALDTRMTAEEDKLPFRNIFPNLRLHPSRYAELASLDASKVMYFRCSAGRFNFSWNNPTGRLWTFPEGTVLHSDGTTPIRTSTDENPDVDVPAGVVTLHSDSWDGSYTLHDHDTNAQFIGDMADLPLVIYYIAIDYCPNFIGDLADCPVVNFAITFTNSALVTGAYTQVSGTNVPTYTYLENTNISPTDMDATLIAYEACTKDNGHFSATGMTRTTASDDAVSYLTGRGWTISGLTVV